MFSPGPTSTNFKGLRRKITNDGSSTSLHTTRPSTASASLHHNDPGVPSLFEPALEGPPSPEGIRAFSRQMKQASIGGLHRTDLVTISSRSSSTHSGSVAPETPSWERSLESLGISRNPSQRSGSMIFKDYKERPESMQLFGKAVFTRKGKMRRENSEQSASNTSLSSSAELPADTTPELPIDQRIMQAVFARRRPRGHSETPKPKIQISTPYNFQHVAHTGKQNLLELDGMSRGQTVNEDSAPQQASYPLAKVESIPLSMQKSLDKPLPTPPPPSDELERVLTRDGPPMSPHSSSAHPSPIPPPPRTSSRISVRHDRYDSVEERPHTGYSLHRVNSSISSLSDGSRPLQGSYFPLDDTEEPVSPMNDVMWPLNNASVSSLAKVPEEDEYLVQTRNSIVKNRASASLRGSLSVPYLRHVSLSQGTHRSPSNASDTLGRFDLFAMQRALRDGSDTECSDNDQAVDTWEDDIDYCYDHEAEADCEFAWERPSLDMTQPNHDHIEDSRVTHFRMESSDSIEFLTSGTMIDKEVPALSPTGYGSKATTVHEAITPTSTTLPRVPSNFSLPRIDSSTRLKRDHESQSSISSFSESQGFSLSPSLLIPNDYHEQMLQFERGEAALFEEPGRPQVEDQTIGKPATLLPARCSGSTCISTSSEQSMASSYEQSSASSAYTRWTGSSNSSWQAQFTDPSPPPVSITLNDKEQIVTPTADTTPKSEEPPRIAAQPEIVRESHSRTQSDATLLMKTPAMDTIMPLNSNMSKEPPKTHRRARTSSRSHANVSPQFALFPQIPRRA